MAGIHFRTFWLFYSFDKRTVPSKDKHGIIIFNIPAFHKRKSTLMRSPWCLVCITPFSFWITGPIFTKFWYDHYAIGGHHNYTIFNFLQSAVTSWWTHELVRGKWHLIDSIKMMCGNRSKSMQVLWRYSFVERKTTCQKRTLSLYLVFSFMVITN